MVRLEKKHLIKPLAAIPLLFVLYGYMLIAGTTWQRTFSQMFCDVTLGVVDFDSFFVYTKTVENIAFIVIFNVMFSSHISNHFRYSSVYVFTRLKDRTKWYFCRAFEIIGCAFCYVLLYVLSAVILSVMATGQPVDMVSLARILLVFLVYFSIVSATALLVNILSLRFGTAIGFFIADGGMFALTAAFLTLHNVKVLSVLNPMSCLNLFQLGEVHGWFTAIYVFAIFIAVFFIGQRYITNYDIAMFDPELN